MTDISVYFLVSCGRVPVLHHVPRVNMFTVCTQRPSPHEGVSLLTDYYWFICFTDPCYQPMKLHDLKVCLKSIHVRHKQVHEVNTYSEINETFAMSL